MKIKKMFTQIVAFTLASSMLTGCGLADNSIVKKFTKPVEKEVIELGTENTLRIATEEAGAMATNLYVAARLKTDLLKEKDYGKDKDEFLEDLKACKYAWEMSVEFNILAQALGTSYDNEWWDKYQSGTNDDAKSDVNIDKALGELFDFALGVKDQDLTEEEAREFIEKKAKRFANDDYDYDEDDEDDKDDDDEANKNAKAWASKTEDMYDAFRSGWIIYEYAMGLNRDAEEAYSIVSEVKTLVEEDDHVYGKDYNKIAKKTAKSVKEVCESKVAVTGLEANKPSVKTLNTRDDFYEDGGLVINGTNMAVDPFSRTIVVGSCDKVIIPRKFFKKNIGDVSHLMVIKNIPEGLYETNPGFLEDVEDRMCDIDKMTFVAENIGYMLEEGHVLGGNVISCEDDETMELETYEININELSKKKINKKLNKAGIDMKDVAKTRTISEVLESFESKYDFSREEFAIYIEGLKAYAYDEEYVKPDYEYDEDGIVKVYEQESDFDEDVPAELNDSDIPVADPLVDGDESCGEIIGGIPYEQIIGTYQMVMYDDKRERAVEYDLVISEDGPVTFDGYTYYEDTNYLECERQRFTNDDICCYSELNLHFNVLDGIITIDGLEKYQTDDEPMEVYQLEGTKYLD